MQYRRLGNTGVNVSVLGFGCLRLPEIEKNGFWYIDEEKAIPLLKSAYDNGVNYFDTAPSYCHGNTEKILGQTLKDVRSKVYLANKLSLGNEVVKTSDFRKELETSLRKMDTNYIDFYHFWGINKDVFENKIVRLNLLDEALKIKEEGLIKHISFSFHDEPRNVRYIIDKAKIFETVLLRYHFLDLSNEEEIIYANRNGIGVIDMGPAFGGRIFCPENLSESHGKKSSVTYELALRFVLGNGNISCALSGMENMSDLDNNLRTVDDKEPLTELEMKKISSAVEEMKKIKDLYCSGCGYCQPCPAKINIPVIFNAYTFHNVYGLSQTAKNDFMTYKKNFGNATLSSCIDCGRCEEKCPQKIKIRIDLKRVEKVLNSI